MTTIRDIARALGITPSTVSRALSGNPRVKEETRRAVEKTAREMGYERNIVAANLRKGRSMIVGIVIPRIHREFFSNCIGGAESVLNQAGYSVLICQTLESVEAEIQALKTLKNYRVAGVLLSHAINAPNGDHVKEILGNTPLIQFDRVFPDLPGAESGSLGAAHRLLARPPRRALGNGQKICSAHGQLRHSQIRGCAAGNVPESDSGSLTHFRIRDFIHI